MLDLWFDCEVKPRLQDRAFLIRYPEKAKATSKKMRAKDRRQRLFPMRSNDPAANAKVLLFFNFQFETTVRLRNSINNP